MPTQGPLDQDLGSFIQTLVDYACRADVRAGVTGLMADADTDTELPGLVDGLLIPLRNSLLALIDAGVARGEVRSEMRTDLDVDLALNTIRGAVTMHLIADQTPPGVVVEHLEQLMTWAFRAG